MNKKPVTLSIDKKLLKQIDRKRDLISRTAFVEKILVDALDGEKYE
ncbi:MAG: hypothetical protein WD717_03910 [Nitrosarchaeum sp.]